MCALFRNRYRIGSTRYRGYDYSSPGKYFITICTKNKTPCFGKIENRKIILSEMGRIAEKLWLEIPNHFPFVGLDEYIIMPDHIHGIIIIRQSNIKSGCLVETPKLGVSTKLSSESNPPSQTNNPYWKSNSIGLIINQFKRICTITVKSNGHDFAWQSRYHDHIIRTNTELYRIRKYISMNPQKNG
jgi:REP element-mobilizing transposase RayT